MKWRTSFPTPTPRSSGECWPEPRQVETVGRCGTPILATAHRNNSFPWSPRCHRSPAYSTVLLLPPSNLWQGTLSTRNSCFLRSFYFLVSIFFSLSILFLTSSAKVKTAHFAPKVQFLQMAGLKSRSTHLLCDTSSDFKSLCAFTAISHCVECTSMSQIWYLEYFHICQLWCWQNHICETYHTLDKYTVIPQCMTPLLTQLLRDIPESCLSAFLSP